jgi:hypothetical protein
MAERGYAEIHLRWVSKKPCILGVIMLSVIVPSFGPAC